MYRYTPAAASLKSTGSCFTPDEMLDVLLPLRVGMTIDDFETIGQEMLHDGCPDVFATLFITPRPPIASTPSMQISG